MDLKRCIFSGMQVLVGHHWLTAHAVVVEEGKIKAIIPVDMVKHHLPATLYEYPSYFYLIPGLIDLHVHGAQGCDVMDGTADALHTISRALAEEGVTGYLATTMTAESERIVAALTPIPMAMQQQEGAAILGVHLEGPFIAKDKMGAQAGHECLPDIALLRQWQSVAEGAIKVVTLAPELPGAIPFIEALNKMEVIASAGHTNATYDETYAAIAAGCTQATHLFNAMRGLHQREPGAVGALLLSNEVSAELIVDGLHLHPAIADLALRVKGKDRLLLVSDAMRAKCLSDGEYELGGQAVKVSAGKVTLPNGTLAGSTLRLPQAIKKMVHFTKCSLEDAIQMASYNPAKVLGLSLHKGSIEIGKDADLVVLNAELDVVMTMREGREVFNLT